MDERFEMISVSVIDDWDQRISAGATDGGDTAY
jgi:hypothetical protein